VLDCVWELLSVGLCVRIIECGIDDGPCLTSHVSYEHQCEDIV
jgi:hypothetical protein